MKQRSEKIYWAYGKHSCIRMLNNPQRKIKKILVTKNNYNLIPSTLLHITQLVEYSKITEMTKHQDVVHQGIAISTEYLPQINIETYLQRSQSMITRSASPELIVMLDQISDPQNIGNIFRSAACFNVSAIVTTFDNAPKETASLVKTAVGAFELIPFINVTNLVNTLQLLKKHGYWICGLEGEATQTIKTIGAMQYDKLVVVLGSEDSGLRELTRKNCDLLGKIAIDSHMESLNVATAAAIALYELSQTIKLQQ